MTKQEAYQEFCKTQLPSIQVLEEGRVDLGRRRLEWNNWTHELHVEGRITSAQYANWETPKGLLKRVSPTARAAYAVRRFAKILDGEFSADTHSELEHVLYNDPYGPQMVRRSE